MKRSVLLLLSVFVVLLGGCAEAFFPGGVGYSVNVTPASATLPGLTTQQFAATANDGSRPTLNWSVNGIAGGNSTLGTISATGLYTAPEFPPLRTPSSSTPRMPLTLRKRAAAPSH